MKKYIPTVVGIALFIAGYNYIRLQAHYVAANPPVANSAYAITPMAMPIKPSPTFAFRLDKSILSKANVPF
ncbi:hypothetical protein [Spirosoma areae]